MNKKNLMYLVLIGLIIILGFIFFQTQMNRGVQGRLKTSADDIGDSFSKVGAQYEPYYLQRSRAAVSMVPVASSNPVVQGKIDRKVIKNANLSLKVQDAQKTQIIISSIVTKFQGLISNSNINNSAVGNINGTTVFKVLPKDLENVLLELKNLGEVQSEVQSGEDVTEQYVDLQARLNNYKLVRDRLLKILDEKAREVKDILEVESELARVGGEIEALEGRIRFLDQQTDMSTVTVYFFENKLGIMRGINFGDKFKDTLHSSAEVFANTFNGVIIFISFVFPIALWSLLGWGTWCLIRRILKK